MLVAQALRSGNIDRLDRELLLASVLKKDRAFLLSHPEHILSPRKIQHFKKLIGRREHHEPLAYILGEKEFFGISFLVNRSTLIPRPETEIIVEDVLKQFSRLKTLVNKKIAVVDVGTGSGCIIISVVKNLLLLKKDLNTISFFAVDTSLRALNTAHSNAKRHDADKNIQFVHSNLLTQLKKQLLSFDEIIILANLPYLSEKLYQTTPSTVQHFEPKSALLSGQDGLNHYRALLKQLKSLSPGKRIEFWLEISPEQASVARALLQEHSAILDKILPDLAEKFRVIKGHF